ncbi:MAG: hypothetical protein GVY14_03720 [Spirochaetes bacterium]|jgi:hypothetical protein|nr:hypothetical protein [Spirochaetota bacterium]
MLRTGDAMSEDQTPKQAALPIIRRLDDDAPLSGIKDALYPYCKAEQDREGEQDREEEGDDPKRTGNS